MEMKAFKFQVGVTDEIAGIAEIYRESGLVTFGVYAFLLGVADTVRVADNLLDNLLSRSKSANSRYKAHDSTRQTQTQVKRFVQVVTCELRPSSHQCFQGVLDFATSRGYGLTELEPSGRT